MKTLLISGQTLTQTPWNIEDVLSTSVNRSTKDQLERAQWYDFNEKQRVREFYESSYLNLEYNKTI
jgi:hypothetical protein